MFFKNYLTNIFYYYICFSQYRLPINGPVKTIKTGLKQMERLISSAALVIREQDLVHKSS